jgi:hypothetical protein
VGVKYIALAFLLSFETMEFQPWTDCGTNPFSKYDTKRYYSTVATSMDPCLVIPYVCGPVWNFNAQGMNCCDYLLLDLDPTRL